MAMQNPDSILTIEELAVYLKLSKSTLYKLCVEGKVPGQKVGRHWRFHRTVIDQWIGLKPDANRTNPIVPQGGISKGDIKGTIGTSAGSAGKGAGKGPKGPGTLRAARTKNRGSHQ